jgi:hypothetical protein
MHSRQALVALALALCVTSAFSVQHRESAKSRENADLAFARNVKPLLVGSTTETTSKTANDILRLALKGHYQVSTHSQRPIENDNFSGVPSLAQKKEAEPTDQPPHDPLAELISGIPKLTHPIKDEDEDLLNVCPKTYDTTSKTTIPYDPDQPAACGPVDPHPLPHIEDDVYYEDLPFPNCAKPKKKGYKKAVRVCSRNLPDHINPLIIPKGGCPGKIDHSHLKPVLIKKTKKVSEQGNCSPRLGAPRGVQITSDLESVPIFKARTCPKELPKDTITPFVVSKEKEEDHPAPCQPYLGVTRGTHIPDDVKHIPIIKQRTCEKQLQQDHLKPIEITKSKKKPIAKSCDPVLGQTKGVKVDEDLSLIPSIYRRSCPSDSKRFPKEHLELLEVTKDPPKHKVKTCPRTLGVSKGVHVGEEVKPLPFIEVKTCPHEAVPEVSTEPIEIKKPKKKFPGCPQKQKEHEKLDMLTPLKSIKKKGHCRRFGHVHIEKPIFIKKSKKCKKEKVPVTVIDPLIIERSPKQAEFSEINPLKISKQSTCPTTASELSDLDPIIFPKEKPKACPKKATEDLSLLEEIESPPQGCPRKAEMHLIDPLKINKKKSCSKLAGGEDVSQLNPLYIGRGMKACNPAKPDYSHLLPMNVTKQPNCAGSDLSPLHPVIVKKGKKCDKDDLSAVNPIKIEKGCPTNSVDLSILIPSRIKWKPGEKRPKMLSKEQLNAVKKRLQQTNGQPYSQQTSAPQRKLTDVERFLLSLKGSSSGRGTRDLFAKNGHLAFPSRLDRFMKLLLGKTERSIIRHKPYKRPHLTPDLVMQYSGRPDYELSRVKRYITRRQMRILRRKQKLEEEARRKKAHEKYLRDKKAREELEKRSTKIIDRIKVVELKDGTRAVIVKGKNGKPKYIPERDYNANPKRFGPAKTEKVKIRITPPLPPNSTLTETTKKNVTKTITITKIKGKVVDVKKSTQTKITKVQKVQNVNNKKSKVVTTEVTKNKQKKIDFQNKPNSASNTKPKQSTKSTTNNKIEVKKKTEKLDAAGNKKLTQKQKKTIEINKSTDSKNRTTASKKIKKTTEVINPKIKSKEQVKEEQKKKLIKKIQREEDRRLLKGHRKDGGDGKDKRKKEGEKIKVQSKKVSHDGDKKTPKESVNQKRASRRHSNQNNKPLKPNDSSYEEGNISQA